MHERLDGLRCYLGGPMQYVDDNGMTWRAMITPWLEERGVVVLNPCDKPIDIGLETLENKEYRARLRELKQYDKMAAEMRLIRCTDLRLVDTADFLIFWLSKAAFTCGTWEELFSANRSKKPILICFEEGKQQAPDWLFGTIPHNYLFDNWDHLKDYVDHIDKFGEHDKRWMFFKFKELYKGRTA